MTNRLKELLPNPMATDYGIRLQTGGLDLYTEAEMMEFAQRILNECYDVVRGFTYLEEMGACLDGEYDHYEELEAAECLEKHFNYEWEEENE